MMKKVQYLMVGIALGLIFGLISVIEMNIQIEKLIVENQQLLTEIHKRGIKFDLQERKCLKWQK